MPHKDPEVRKAYIRKYNNRWAKQHPEQIRKLKRRSILKNRFGLSVAEYDAMLVRQNGVCAICHNADPTTRSLAVDHDHESGQVRGLLCTRCNPALGYAQDSIERLRAMIDYLELHRDSTR